MKSLSVNCSSSFFCSELAPVANRPIPFEERLALQNESLGLPLLPTTTIGSFPQSAEVRSARQKWRKAEWSDEQYQNFINAETKRWIDIQEELELDVLVHGEFERTDMVEYFGEKLAGFAFTKYAWVQSYGSRCVRPPVIYGDVEFIEPMTVKDTVYAQSLTSKHVKGMLTGPVTILRASPIWKAISFLEMSFRGKDQFKIVTGPVSIPFTCLEVNDCA